MTLEWGQARERTNRFAPCSRSSPSRSTKATSRRAGAQTGPGRRIASRAGRPCTGSSCRRARRRLLWRGRPSCPQRAGRPGGREGGRVGERPVERLGQRGQQERGVGTQDEPSCRVPYCSATNRASASSSKLRSSKPIENVRTGSVLQPPRARSASRNRSRLRGGRRPARPQRGGPHRVAEPSLHLDQLGLSSWRTSSAETGRAGEAREPRRPACHENMARRGSFLVSRKISQWCRDG